MSLTICHVYNGTADERNKRFCISKKKYIRLECYSVFVNFSVLILTQTLVKTFYLVISFSFTNLLKYYRRYIFIYN